MSGEDDGVEFGDGADMGDALDVVEGLEIAEEEVSDDLEAQTVARESKALRYLTTQHPECKLDYIEQILAKLPVTSYPPTTGEDKNHRSVPYVTQYERTKIIGFRANQLSQGARPFVDVPKHVTDVVEIARMELEQRRLPFILKRPMPDGTFEYWRLTDLMIL